MAGNRQSRAHRSVPRLLIVEDEPLVAHIMAEMAHQLGYEVSSLAHSVPQARIEVSKYDYDAALLDIRLGAQQCFEIADLLSEMKIPFAFVTGCAPPLEPRHTQIPLLQKPFTFGLLGSVLSALVGPAEARKQLGQLRLALLP